MKAVFLDLDRTLINDTTIVSFLLYGMKLGLFTHSLARKIYKTKTEFETKKISYETFGKEILQELAQGFQGKKQRDIQTHAEHFWKQVKPFVADWAVDVLNYFHSLQFSSFVISGSNSELLSVYQQQVGFQHFYASEIEVHNGVYTDKIVRNAALFEEKSKIVRSLVKEFSIDLNASVGFGDTFEDRAFLDVCKVKIVIASENGMAEFARKNNWYVFQFTDPVSEYVKKIVLPD